MIEKRKIFITAKTYPTLSKKYDEIVCTAGILDDGSWVRIYPLPFRKLDYENRYRKYQWIEIQLEKNTSDPRPESYKVCDIAQLKLIGEPVGTIMGWAERKRIVFDQNPIYTDLTGLIEQAQRNELSLATFKPEKIIEVVITETEREWSNEKLTLLKAKAKQLSLFQTEEEVRREFSIVDKVPYNFFYRFRDKKGREAKLIIEDWEIGMLYWNCLKNSGGDEQEAVSKVKEKYFDLFSKRDIYLFLGTTKQFHGWAKNPFVIIGVFYPPHEPQLSLF